MKDRSAENRLYYRKHAEQVKAARRAYYLSVERTRANEPARVESNRVRCRDYYQRNRDRVRLAHKAWYQKNRDRALAYWHRRRARLLDGASPGVTDAEWSEILAAWGGRCIYCGATTRITREHVRPLSRGGRDEPDNVAPACLPCNTTKKDRTLPEWYAYLDELTRHGQLPARFLKT